MDTPSATEMEHAAGPGTPRHAVSRWMELVVAAAALVWLARRSVGIFVGPTGEYSWGLAPGSRYGWVLAGACAAAWFGVRRFNRCRARPVSFFAVAAVLVLLLNPLFLGVAFQVLGLRSLPSGINESSYVFCGVVAFGLGMLARAEARWTGRAVRGGSAGGIVASVALIGLLAALALAFLFIYKMGTAFGP